MIKIYMSYSERKRTRIVIKRCICKFTYTCTCERIISEIEQSTKPMIHAGVTLNYVYV